MNKSLISLYPIPAYLFRFHDMYALRHISKIMALILSKEYLYFPKETPQAKGLTEQRRPRVIVFFLVRYIVRLRRCTILEVYVLDLLYS